MFCKHYLTSHPNNFWNRPYDGFRSSEMKRGAQRWKLLWISQWALKPDSKSHGLAPVPTHLSIMLWILHIITWKTQKLMIKKNEVTHNSSFQRWLPLPFWSKPMAFNHSFNSVQLRSVTHKSLSNWDSLWKDFSRGCERCNLKNPTCVFFLICSAHCLMYFLF